MSLRDFLFYEEPGITLYCGDCREVLPLLESESAAVMMTDPPYPKEFSYCWDYLNLAAPILSDGSSVFVYCGHYQVPFVLDTLRKSYGWHWLCIVRNDGAMPRMWGLHVEAAFKPVLWMKKGPHLRWPEHNKVLCDDLAVEPGRWEGGALHKWGQAIARTPLLYTTSPGDLVLDPFVGAGATLYAAKTLGLRAIGIEIEPRYCEIAVKRLRQEVLPLTVASVSSPSVESCSSGAAVGARPAP